VVHCHASGWVIPETGSIPENAEGAVLLLCRGSAARPGRTWFFHDCHSIKAKANKRDQRALLGSDVPPESGFCRLMLEVSETIHA
jgi:hypothetical protein